MQSGPLAGIAVGLATFLVAIAATAEDRLPQVEARLVADGLDAPIFIAVPPDGSRDLLVGDQTGTVHRLEEGTTLALEPFLDLSDRLTPLLEAFDERGLWALAFHPGYLDNGRLFVTYSAVRRDGSPHTGDTAYTWRLSEFHAQPGAVSVDPQTERVLLEFDWINRKHNGGGLAFGQDGYLYVGVGDGGGVHGVPNVYIAPPLDEDALMRKGEIREDPYRLPEEFYHYDGWAQDLARLHGKILRLDVDGGEPYAIPPTNPFANDPRGRPEIYAWGFRNPFRITPDPQHDGFLVSGVAESLWETLYLVDAPGNYGWAVREGTHCFDRRRAFDPPTDCADTDATGAVMRDPIIEYTNWSVMRPWSKVNRTPQGTANVGGTVYAGTALPALTGRIVFGDFSATIEEPSGQVFVASPSSEPGELWNFEPLARIDQRLHGLGTGADGELYLLTTALGIPVGQSGKVWKLVPAE